MEEILGHNTRVALYARVSTEEQREGQTIDSQVAELERFARDRGWIVTGIYKDEGWSGSALARPALDRLRDDGTKNLFGAVLLNDVDRLARDVTHLGVVKRDIERQGVRVIFRKLPTDNSPTRNLMINVLGSFAEFERELIADRTRRGRRHKVEVRKEFLGSLAPYGFRYVRKDQSDDAKGRLEIEPEEAVVVRQIYTWVDQEGLSARKVVERLNRLCLRARKGKNAWARSSVLRMLRSETYAGVWHYYKFEACPPRKPRDGTKYRKSNKSSLRLRPRDEWLPLALPEPLHMVPRDRWERVQRQLDRNLAFSARSSKHVYLLKGLVRCGACGSRYVGQPSHGRFYYRCLTRCRKLPTIKEEQLNDTVWCAVETAILNPDLIAEQLPRVEEVEAQTAAEATEKTRDFDQSLRQIQTEEARILEAYRLEILSSTQLKNELNDLSRRRAALMEQHAATAEQAPAASRSATKRSVAAYCLLAAERLKAFTPEERQRFLQLLIREILFEGSQVRIRGVIPVANPNGPEPRHAEDKGQSSDLGRRIATTTIDLRDRNVAEGVCDARGNFRSHRDELAIPFEITRQLPPPLPHSRPYRSQLEDSAA